MSTYEIWGEHKQDSNGEFIIAMGLTFKQADQIAGNLEEEFPGTRFWTEKE